MRLYTLLESQNTATDFMSALRDFLPFAISAVGITDIPKIHLLHHLESATAFASYDPNQHCIYLAIKDRHPLDILRSLAHELIHAQQRINNQLHPNSGKTGSDHENEANAGAGVIMRQFGRRFPQYYH